MAGDDRLLAQLASGVLDDADIDLFASPDALPEVSGEDWETTRANQYPEAVRLYALRLWTFDAGRNPRRVAELMQERAGLTIPASTIRRWSLQDGWAERAGELHQAFSDISSSTTRHMLSALMPDAVHGLRRVLTSPTSPETAVVRAASLVLGIGGYVPAMQGHIVNLAVNVGRDRLGEKTDEELRELASAYQPDPDHSPGPTVTDAEYRIASRQRIAAAEKRKQDGTQAS
jgi:hypothetical protein